MTSNNASSGASAAERIEAVRSRMNAAAIDAGRRPQDVVLVAVSKTFDVPDIVPFIDAGLRVFGENRVQEAASKWPELKERQSDVELHLIGPLQSNKVGDAVGLFDVLQTLDRVKLAEALTRVRDKGARLPRLFVQVNTGEEPQKAGVIPDELDDFIARCQKELQLDIEGLMCIPPVNEEPALHFALLQKLAQRNGISGLSMGMSGDFETAIRFGATHVRVGSALFGTRT